MFISRIEIPRNLLKTREKALMVGILIKASSIEHQGGWRCGVSCRGCVPNLLLLFFSLFSIHGLGMIYCCHLAMGAKCPGSELQHSQYGIKKNIM